MKKIAFVCTANSCRSQMAEGFARLLGRGAVEVWSAGLIKAGVNERAAAVMREAGVDISGQWSKTLDEIPVREMDLVVTLCDNADMYCPNVGSKKVHKPVKDPVAAVGPEKDVMNDFRRARDEIKMIVSDLLAELAAAPDPQARMRKPAIH